MPSKRTAPSARNRAVKSRQGAGQKWWMPVPKWFGQLVSGLATIGGSWIVTGAFDDVERGMSGTLLTTLAATWVISNQGKGG